MALNSTNFQNCYIVGDREPGAEIVNVNMCEWFGEIYRGCEYCGGRDGSTRGVGVDTPNWGSSWGLLGVENKPKNEVKVQNFTHKMSIKPRIFRLLHHDESRRRLHALRSIRSSNVTELTNMEVITPRTRYFSDKYPPPPLTEERNSNRHPGIYHPGIYHPGIYHPGIYHRRAAACASRSTMKYIINISNFFYTFTCWF